MKPVIDMHPIIVNEERNKLLQRSTLEQKLSDMYNQAVDQKAKELFGDDFPAYINRCIETKKGIDVEKINALRDYIKIVYEMFNQAASTI